MVGSWVGPGTFAMGWALEELEAALGDKEIISRRGKCPYSAYLVKISIGYRRVFIKDW
jgi:hypothetical protein